MHKKAHNHAIIDSVMGSGKSEWAIATLQQTEHPTIVVVELDSEVDRYLARLPHFVTPKKAAGPQESLSNAFRRLVKEGKSIVTTHALFNYWNPVDLAYIELYKYQLYMDEVLEGQLQSHGISSDDIDKLLKWEHLLLKPFQCDVLEVSYFNKEALLDDYKWIAEEAETRKLFVSQGTDSKGASSYTMYSVVSPLFYKAFSRVVVMTYLFENSFMEKILEMQGIQYERYSILFDGVTKTLGAPQSPSGAQYRHLINLHTTKSHNQLPDKKGRTQLLSRGSMVTPSGKPKVFCKEVQDLLRNVTLSWKRAADKTSGGWERDLVMWTTHKAAVSGVAHRYFHDSARWAQEESGDLPEHQRGLVNFVAQNRRGTNLFSDKKYLLHAANTLLNPKHGDFFSYLGMSKTEVGAIEDNYALSTLIQWVWRSRIRKSDYAICEEQGLPLGTPSADLDKYREVTLFVAAPRMRHLLMNWLGYEAKEVF